MGFRSITRPRGSRFKFELRQHQLGSTSNAEFLVNRMQLHFDCAFTQTQSCRYLLIREAVTGQRCDLLLPVSQPDNPFILSH